MKRIITGDELKQVKKEAVNTLCDAVASTLGPSGNNVLISNSEVSPFITNDGVTIASNISSTNEAINSIYEIVKEASLKTNEIVGDGTTTTMVLLQEIFNEGLKEIDSGKNPIVLKEELNKSLVKVLSLIKKLNKSTKTSDLESIASVAANSIEIGRFLSEIYLKMKSKYSIKLTEGTKLDTYYRVNYGYDIEIDGLSNMYFKKTKELKLRNAYILLIKGYLQNLEQISEAVNEALTSNKILIIFTEDYDESIKQELLVYFLNANKNIFIIKLPDYASHREKIETDISTLASATIKNIDYERIYFSDLGVIKNVVIRKEEIILSIAPSKVKKLVAELQAEVKTCTSEYEKDFLISRLSKLENGIATIYVGGNTKTEIREKIMRYEDALCALEIAKEGVVLGGGVTLLDVSDKLSINTLGDAILQKALRSPFERIAENTGKDSSIIKKEIINSKYNKIYNFKDDQYETAEATKILDPVEVVISALRNAVSISSILLTINYLVVNQNIENEKEVL